MKNQSCKNSAFTSKIMNFVQQQIQCVNKKTESCELLKQAEKQIGIDRGYLVIGAGMLVLIISWLVLGGLAVSNTIGFLYPAFCTMHTILSIKFEKNENYAGNEEKAKLKSTNEEASKLWMSYWMIYSSIVVIETLSDILLNWIPNWYFVKVIFLCWMMSPYFKGSNFVVDKLLIPGLMSLCTYSGASCGSCPFTSSTPSSKVKQTESSKTPNKIPEAGNAGVEPQDDTQKTDENILRQRVNASPKIERKGSSSSSSSSSDSN